MTHEFRDPTSNELLYMMDASAPIERTVQWSIQNDPKVWSKDEDWQVMRIERDRIWVNPNVEVTEAAKRVLAALDLMLQHRYQEVWNEAIEAAIKNVDSCGFVSLEQLQGLKK